MGAFARLEHVYGAGLVFLIATTLIGCALFRFFQEVRVGLQELVSYAGAANPAGSATTTGWSTTGRRRRRSYSSDSRNPLRTISVAPVDRTSRTPAGAESRVRR